MKWITRPVFGMMAVAAVMAAGAAFFTSRLPAFGKETTPPPAFTVSSKPIDRDAGRGTSYAAIVKKVAPSVVNIYSSGMIRQRVPYSPFYGDPRGERSRRANRLGSGVIVTPDGYILTANHVVEGADEIKVVLANDKTTEYTAKVIGSDPPTDVALLKIDAQSLPTLTLGDSDQIEVGDVVLAIGNPLGVGKSVTHGIISALGRSLDSSGASLQYQDYIQTDAAVNQGNSGGALVDVEGRLIGLNDAILSPSGASAGLGFAIPVNLIRNVMESFISSGKVARGYLGVDLQDVDSGLAKSLGLPSADGALVPFVDPGSPADKAGLKARDVIVAVNGKAIASVDNLKVTVSQLRPGTQAKLKIFRDGAARTLTATLGEQPPAMTEAETAKPEVAEDNTPPTADALDGVSVQDLTPRIRRELGRQGISVPAEISGVLVIDVDQSANAFDAGLRRGNVIIEIDRQPVANCEDAVKLCQAARGEQILLKIWRPTRGGGGMVRYLSVNNTHRTK